MEETCVHTALLHYIHYSWEQQVQSSIKSLSAVSSVNSALISTLD
jgi:hypothetical protein